jgi:hypothetical protein
VNNFFDVIFPELVGMGKYISVWIKNKDVKKSYWFTDPHAANAFCLSPQCSGFDVYFGLGLSNHDYGEHKRCQAADVAGIPGFWVDIDCLCGLHDKKNLPAKEEALKIIEGVYKPSMIVDTVGGYHCYWLFNEILLFDAADERQKVGRLLNDFQNYLKNTAKNRGWELDKTHDLSRVLRVPGVISTKYNKIVTVYEYSDERFNVSDFEMFRTEDFPNVYTLPQKTAFDYNLPPPLEKLQIILVNDENFNKTWYHKRRMQDQSQSAYDMSLANIAFEAGWTDQEIVSLLVCNRQLYNPQSFEKHKPEDYYPRTINNVKNSLKQMTTTLKNEKVEDNIETQKTIKEIEDSDGFEAISKLLGINILSFEKYTSDPVTYAIRIEGVQGSIQLGQAKDILNQNVFRTRIFEVANIVTTKIKNTKSVNLWEKVIQELNSKREEIELGEELKEEGETVLWIESYLRDQGNIADFDDSDCVHLPRKDKNNIVWISGLDFRKWLGNSVLNEKISAKALGKRMRNIGCGFTRIKRQKITFQIWSLPEQISLNWIDE